MMEEEALLNAEEAALDEEEHLLEMQEAAIAQQEQDNVRTTLYQHEQIILELT